MHRSADNTQINVRIVITRMPVFSLPIFIVQLRTSPSSRSIHATIHRSSSTLAHVHSRPDLEYFFLLKLLLRNVAVSCIRSLRKHKRVAEHASTHSTVAL